MPRNTNVVILTGRLGADIDVRKAGEVEVGSFRVINNQDYKNKAGDWVEVACGFTIETWKPSDYLKENLAKGQLVNITGTLVEDTWKNDAGEKRYKTLIKATSIEIVRTNGAAKKEETAEADAPAEEAPAAETKTAAKKEKKKLPF